MNLRKKIIHLAHDNPPLRRYLLPMLAVKTATDKVYATQVAFGLWVRGDAHARKTLEGHLEGYLESVVSRLHDRNQPRRSDPIAPARGRGKKPAPVEPQAETGPHEVIPVTVERVWEEAQQGLPQADLLRGLDGGGFHQWFDDHLGNAMASLGGITVGVARSHPEVKGNTLVWEGKWFGAEQDEDTEVAADTVEDDLEKVITKLQGKSGFIPARIEYLRNIGWQGNEAGHYSVYPMTAVFPVDPLRFLEAVFTKAGLPGIVAGMITKALARLE